MQSPGPHIIAHIRSLGYRVTITLNPDGTTTLTATHRKTGERHIATAPGDGYAAACLLAESVGIDLE